jgi:hypothetical protein
MGCKLSAEWRGIQEEGNEYWFPLSLNPYYPRSLPSCNSFPPYIFSCSLKILLYGVYQFLFHPFHQPLQHLSPSLSRRRWSRLLSLLPFLHKIIHRLLHCRGVCISFTSPRICLFCAHKWETEFFFPRSFSHPLYLLSLAHPSKLWYEAF